MRRDDQAAWREHRRTASAFHAGALDRRRKAEGAQARALIADFVRAATQRGISPERLVARSYSSGAAYRTGLSGWYVRNDHTLAVGIDGEYYVLMVSGGPLARLTGVRLTPALPPLVVGVGARDGESRELADLLRERLQRG